MKKIILMILLILSVVVISGCDNTEFGRCYYTCRSKEYYKYHCSDVATSIVIKNCNISNETISEIKDECFDLCIGLEGE